MATTTSTVTVAYSEIIATTDSDFTIQNPYPTDSDQKFWLRLHYGSSAPADATEAYYEIPPGGIWQRGGISGKVYCRIHSVVDDGYTHKIKVTE